MNYKVKFPINTIKQIRFSLPLLGGLIFWIAAIYIYQYPVFISGFLILGWGTSSLAAVYFRRDPSWNLIMSAGLFSFCFLHFLILPRLSILTSLGILTISICFTYIASKIGCYKNRCCRAKRITQILNPKTFKTFDWLQLTEIIVTTLLLLIILYLVIIKCSPQLAFPIFMLGHAMFRTFAYFFRYPKFSYFSFLFQIHLMQLLLTLILVLH